jgi:hypothetical protein
MQVVPMYGNQYSLTEDPLNELSLCKKATIRQQAEYLQILSGYEGKNRYDVFITLPNGMEKYLFKCKEESSACQRQCCPSDSREFKMKIKHISNPMDFFANYEKYYAKLDKPFKCTCLCCNRPTITGIFQNDNQFFGSVTQEYTCCDPLFEIKNAKGVKYVITIDCDQCSFCCSCCCSKFNKVECIISDVGRNRKPVGKITKTPARNFVEIVGDADTYEIEFPPDATPHEKLSIIMAGLFIDYRYFELMMKGINGYYYDRRTGVIVY